jgi:NAD(P)-dependent dehydrogenase (short-subunit alcohol dehydrogenase family)
MSSTVFITGANRGIGLEFTRQYLRDKWSVIATCRHPENANELNSLHDDTSGELIVEKLDITESDQIEAVHEVVSDKLNGLDLLINNAGVYGEKDGFEDLSAKDLRQPFDVNCVGSFRVTRAFLDLLRENRGNVALLTSLMGSIEDNRSGGSNPYRISKAALNMLGKTLAEDYRDEGLYVAILHPGWVRTRMGGPNAKISVEESVSGLREVIARLDADRSGEFYAYDGEKRPW